MTELKECPVMLVEFNVFAIVQLPLSLSRDNGREDSSLFKLTGAGETSQAEVFSPALARLSML
jgi:hypothetical protein